MLIHTHTHTPYTLFTHTHLPPPTKSHLPHTPHTYINSHIPHTSYTHNGRKKKKKLKRYFIQCRWEVKWCSHFGKQSSSSSKGYTELPYNKRIPILVIYPRVVKRFFHAKTYTQMFIEALFITKKKWK